MLLKTFIEAVSKGVVERFSDKNKIPENSLTDNDKNAVEPFKKRNDLVTTKADKGGATVILDVKDCIANANEKLQDNSFYQKLNVDPTAKHFGIVNSAIESFRKQELLSNSTASKLSVDEEKNTSIPYFTQSS